MRAWIGGNENLKEESRRYLLLLDSIRRCEGVARLLQARPGETVDVKPSKNRIVPINVPGQIQTLKNNINFAFEIFNFVLKEYKSYSFNAHFSHFTDGADGNPGPATNPAGNPDRPDSPVAQILEAIPAELYVANQHQWVGLRKSSKMLPFCCR